MSLSTMLAANGVSPRAAQALMRHTDPRLTAGVYTDERILPLAAELLNVPAIVAAGSVASAGTGSAAITSAAGALPAAKGGVHSLLAGLSAEQKQSLLDALTQPVAV